MAALRARLLASLVQEACPPVEAQPRPARVDLLLARRGERLDSRECLHPREPVRNDLRLGLGLGLGLGWGSRRAGASFAVRRGSSASSCLPGSSRGSAYGLDARLLAHDLGDPHAVG